MEMDLVTRELLSRARDGDRTALGQLLEHYRGNLRDMAQQLLDDRAAPRIDASDLVQQTCLSVYQHFGEFDGQEAAQFWAWMRQIHEHNIQNAARDQLHTAKRAVDREQEQVDDRLHLAEQTSPSQQVARIEEATRLARAIAQLPDDEREALTRRYLDGQSLAEAADAMRLTKDALVWLMKRGMKNLRTKLGDAKS